MEEITNYIENKILMDYYKSNIDFHIEYLLFLNSLGNISKESFLNLAPILVKIKEELYMAFPYDSIPDYTKHVNIQIEEKLAELFERENIGEVRQFIGFNVDKKDIYNFSAALMLKRAFSGLNEINDTSHEALIANTIIRQLKTFNISSNIKIDGISPSMMDFFTVSLGIKYCEYDRVESYLYTVISLSEVLLSLLDKINEIKDKPIDPRFLIKELNNDLTIKSTHSLSNIIERIQEGIIAANKQKKVGQLILEKQD